MKRFVIENLSLIGLKLIIRQRLSDHRGLFSRLFCTNELATAGWKGPVAQVNYSHTVRPGAVRGLHYQRSPYAETKLITCVQGEVWDVVVDLRKGSDTFLQWSANILSESNNKSLLIPEGFAHGFQVLSGDATLIYCHSTAYAPEAEGGVHVHDPRLSIDWPLPIVDVSDKDMGYELIAPTFKGLEL